MQLKDTTAEMYQKGPLALLWISTLELMTPELELSQSIYYSFTQEDLESITASSRQHSLWEWDLQGEVKRYLILLVPIHN